MDPLKFYKCLSDDTRLKSLLLIAANEELCVCEITVALDKIQPMISRHLAQLRKYGLLADERKGQWVYYSIHPDLPNWAKEVIFQTRTQNPDFVSEEQQRLNFLRSKSQTNQSVIC